MRILSIDVGIKHLAFCLLNYQSKDEYSIEKWDVINLCNDKIHNCCGQNSQKNPVHVKLVIQKKILIFAKYMLKTRILKSRPKIYIRHPY